MATETERKRRAKLLAMLLDHDADNADVLVNKIEALYGKAKRDGD